MSKLFGTDGIRGVADGAVATSLRVSTCLAVFLLGTVVWVPGASAHKDDYLNETFVYRTLDKGEVELEFWSDLFSTGNDTEPRGIYIPTVEWGITDHFMLDTALEVRPGAGSEKLQRARTELRYRFSEEGRHAVDFAVSLEYEWEREEETGQILQVLTPRLVLNRDFRKKLNVTLNLDAGTRIKGSPRFAPGYRLGVRYPDAGRVRYGVELQELFPGRPEGLLIPQIWITPKKDISLRIGYAKRISHAGQKDHVRLGIEIEF